MARKQYIIGRVKIMPTGGGVGVYLKKDSKEYLTLEELLFHDSKESLKIGDIITINIIKESEGRCLKQKH